MHSSPERRYELTVAEVDRIHLRLQLRYGARWASLYQGFDADQIAGVKADWLRVLQGVTPRGIRYALDNCSPDFPPNAAQFRALCIQAPAEPRKALPAPEPDPAGRARIAALLRQARERMGTETPAERLRRHMDRIRALVASGEASTAQREWLEAAEEAQAEKPDVAQLGEFTPPPVHVLPPGMRADIEQRGHL